jgi:DNA-binding NarL/FixJ family response regulator
MRRKWTVSASPLLAALRGLNERRRGVLQGVLDGDTEAEIAEELQISELVVIRELRAIYHVLGVKRRDELVVMMSPVLAELHRYLAAQANDR